LYFLQTQSQNFTDEGCILFYVFRHLIDILTTYQSMNSSESHIRIYTCMYRDKINEVILYTCYIVLLIFILQS
jgi:hypothetical protein